MSCPAAPELDPTKEGIVKRAPVFLLALALAFALLASCGEERGGGGGGGSSPEELLDLLPRNAIGLFAVDVGRIMQSDLATQALQDQEDEQEKLEDFTARTGIDPTRDISALAGVILEAKNVEDADAVVVMRVEYDRDKLLAALEEEHGDVQTETYQDVTLVTLPANPTEEVNQLAFLNERTVAMGPPADVRTVIDVAQGRAENVKKNEALMAVVEGIDRSGIFWAGALISEETARTLSEGNAMLKNLSGLRSMVMSVDYRDQVLSADVALRSDNQEQNTQIADFLIGMKSFAAMGASEKPELADVLRKITITSGPKEVRISASIPENLLVNLKEEGD